MRNVIRQMLEEVGHEVVQAADGMGAMRLFRERPADLVVTDLFMPEKSGWETLRELQEMAPGLPFIVISDGAALELLKPGTEGVLEIARRLGAFRVLRKPFAWHELTRAVEALLAGRGPA